MKFRQMLGVFMIIALLSGCAGQAEPQETEPSKAEETVEETLAVVPETMAAPHGHKGHKGHRDNDGLRLAAGIVHLVKSVIAPAPVVVAPPPPPVVTAPAPVVVAPPPPPVVVVPPRRPVVVTPPRYIPPAPRHHRQAPPRRRR